MRYSSNCNCCSLAVIPQVTLRSAFEQSLCFRSTGNVWTPAYSSMLPATKGRSRTCATRATDVISERKHCSRRRRYTQVELSSPRKCADKTQTIARKRWHGARKRRRWNVRSTCGRFNTVRQLSDAHDLSNHQKLDHTKQTITVSTTTALDDIPDH